MDQLKIIAFTHRNVSLDQVGWLHCDNDQWKKHLIKVKEQLNIDEIVYISTCNRVEFIMIYQGYVDQDFLQQFTKTFKPQLDDEKNHFLAEKAKVFNGLEAAEHLFRVASSIDSMVVGEREIITQVRKAFEASREEGLMGVYLNVLLKSTVQSAKRVYTETQIAQKPVSVVSLAYHRLKDLQVPLDAKVLIVGAGVTNNNMAKFLYKHGYTNFTVFNRTAERGQALSQKINADFHPFEDLKSYAGGFDLLITCTSAEEPIITKEVYQTLINNSDEKKIIVDLAVPKDTQKEVMEDFKVKYIDVEKIKKVSEQNLAERSKEVDKVENIIAECLEEADQLFRKRALEIAMKDVPSTIKDIRSTAVNDIFAKDLEEMDSESRATLEKVITYMEKKYISLPMKMAREILIEQQHDK